MAFDEIYFEHHKMVFNLALQYVQNKEDAEEITQDVFVKIHKNLDSFNYNSNLKTWIYRITINQSLDFIKSKNAKKRNFLALFFSSNDESEAIENINFNHPGVLLEDKEACSLIFAAINKLPDTQKTALILLKIEHKSQKETAEIMNMKVKALESLYFRAKKNLEILLKSKESNI
jgi:RNA polymerase sigma factor (sigma-70 family)